MGTRASRIQEESLSPAFEKDGSKRDSYRRPQCDRPSSLMVDFSGSFEDTETNGSRSEEGSDLDQGHRVAIMDGSPTDHRSIPSAPDQASPASDNSEGRPEEGGTITPGPPVASEHQPREETDRTPQRTFSERLPGNRHSSSRSTGVRSSRVRGIHQRPVSEAWIGLYRVNNRHGSTFWFTQADFILYLNRVVNVIYWLGPQREREKFILALYHPLNLIVKTLVQLSKVSPPSSRVLFRKKRSLLWRLLADENNDGTICMNKNWCESGDIEQNLWLNASACYFNIKFTYMVVQDATIHEGSFEEEVKCFLTAGTIIQHMYWCVLQFNCLFITGGWQHRQYHYNQCVPFTHGHTTLSALLGV